MRTIDYKKQQEEKRQFWDVKRSGEHLLWLLGPSKEGSFKKVQLKEKDFDALKSVLGFINRQSSDNVKNNQLFAKLYIHFLTQGIRYHQTTVFDTVMQNELHKLLNYPLPLFYKAFVKDLHDNQLNRLLQVKDDQLKEVIIDAQHFKETYNEDFVSTKLDEWVNEAINKFS